VADGVRASMHTPVLDLVGRSSLGVTAAVVRRAVLVVTNDTGMSHLVAAVGTPSVIVFSVTNPRRWKPAGERHRAVVAGALEPTIAAVLSGVAP
jgi:ADP-heptose:LPS heptosyltransferase